ncbi:Mu transposase domain-containing protein, partial [Syntrophomonas palmitatica]|uniref:Mu transposase domain-containing protein n=1 Tax=Syntrophomonas palmitatica TaxID=402877 RepID=UPI000B2F5ABB
KKIPAEVFAIEQGYLTPVSYGIKKSDDNIVIRKVRKDNTVMYEGNRYTVPTGSFGVHDDVQLEIDGDELLIYAGFCDILLAKHKICLEKGKLIQNNDHLRNKEIKIAEMKDSLKAKFADSEAAGLFLNEIHTRKKRYVRDQFLLIEKLLGEYNPEAVASALDYCLINELYSAVDFKDALNHFSQGLKKVPLSTDPVTIQSKPTMTAIPDVEVAKRDLQEMIRSLKGGNDPWLN